MAKQKKTIVKQQLKEYIKKMDDQLYIVHVPIQLLSVFKPRFIKNGMMRQYAQHLKIIKKPRKNSHRVINSYQTVAYDFLYNKQHHIQIFEFYYDLLLKSV